MANRFYTDNSQRKLSTPPKASSPKAGSKGSVRERVVSYPSAGPEKYAFPKWKGVKKVKQYAQSKGLC